MNKIDSQIAKKDDFHNKAVRQIIIGFSYIRIGGNKQYIEKGLDLIERNINDGTSYSKVLLGKLYYEGKLIPADKMKAVQLFVEAAKQGNPIAYLWLGKFYEKGICGIPFDAKKSVFFYNKAATSGIVYAVAKLANFCQTGFGMEKDEKKALHLLKIAARSGNEDSRIALASYYYVKGTLEEKKKAFSVFMELNENPWARFYIGSAYYNGVVVQQDFDVAAFWLKKSAINGCECAKLLLSVCYFYGNGVPENKDFAMKLLKKSNLLGSLSVGREVVKEADDVFYKLLDNIWNANDFVKIESKKSRPKSKSKNKKMPNVWHEEFLTLCQKSGKTNADIYKRAHISRQTFSKILGEHNRTPKKETVLALAIGLELGISETEKFLADAGYAFSGKNKSDAIVKDFILRKDFNVMKINRALYENNLPLFGSERNAK